MASGYPSSFRANNNNNDFYDMYNSLEGLVPNTNGQVRLGQSPQQQQQFVMDQIRQIPPRASPSMAKRSISEMMQLQQQQQQLLRSVKPRSHQYNHNSPISPLTPFDFSGQSSYSLQPHLQQLRSLSAMSSNSGYNNPSFSNNRVVELEKAGENENKMKNCLQELEKQLLDDKDEEELETFGGDVNNSVASSEWSQTMQNLISQTPNQIPKPFSPTPTSSSSSTTSSSTSSSPMKLSSKQTFIDVATAISDENTEAAAVKIEYLKQNSNPRGDSEQRLSSYMVSAFLSRLNPVQNPPPIQELSSDDQIMATQFLYEASPCFKLAFMSSIQAILDATRDQPSIIHVLDFDIGQGSHYFTLIHKIAERHHVSQQSKPNPSLVPTIFVKITSVSTRGEEFENRGVADRLKMLADRVGIGFKFNSVTKPINELTPHSLLLQPNEALVVNFAFKLSKLSDESVSTENPRDSLLRLVKSFKPRVVTVLEQELNTNTAPFMARVVEASGYYQSLFNFLDSVMSRDGSERLRIEECLGRKLVNSVACEGRERVERCEVFGKWRARMRMAGFLGRPIGGHVADAMRARLDAVYKNNSSFMVKEDGDGLCFGWMDRVLTVASAWC